MAVRRSAGTALGLALVLAAGVAAVVVASGSESDEPDPPDEASEPTADASPTRTAAAEEGLLLPNLRSMAAEDFRVERDGAGRLLRFSASLANLGPGPLLVRPRPPGGRCPDGQHPAVQVLYDDAGDDGRYRLRRDRPRRVRQAGCMVVHRGHDHWHFDAMAAYRLRHAQTGEVVAARRKVSFCLRDNRRAPGVRTTVRREHFGECARDRHQGISPGWVDVYDADLDGQTLRLPDDERRRRFCLELVADPRGLLTETDEADNGTSVGIVVRGDVVARRPGAAC